MIKFILYSNLFFIGALLQATSTSLPIQHVPNRASHYAHLIRELTATVTRQQVQLDRFQEDIKTLMEGQNQLARRCALLEGILRSSTESTTSRPPLSPRPVPAAIPAYPIPSKELMQATPTRVLSPRLIQPAPTTPRGPITSIEYVYTSPKTNSLIHR